MSPQLIINIIIWLITVIFFFAVFEYLQLKKINYIRKYYITSIYFLLASVIVIILYHVHFAMLNFKIDVFNVVILAIFFSIMILIYYYSIKKIGKPHKLIEKNPKKYYIYMEYRYIFSKSFEILFQQTMIILLIIMLKDAGLSLLNICVAFSVTFSLWHLFLIKTMKKMAIVFVISAFLSGFIFPILILNVKNGYIYSYIIHWSYYVILQLIEWTKYKRGKKLMDLSIEELLDM